MVMICDTWWILGIGGYTGYQFQIFKDGTLWTSNPHLELNLSSSAGVLKKNATTWCVCVPIHIRVYIYIFTVYVFKNHIV